MAVARKGRSANPKTPDPARPRLVALLPDPHSLRQVQRVLSSSYSIIPCASSTDVTRALASTLVDVLVVDREDHTGASTLDLISLTRRKFASVAIVLYVAPTPELAHEIVQFSHAGIDDVVLRGADDLRRVLARTVALAADAALTRRAAAVLEPLLPPNVQSILRACLEQRDGDVGVSKLARTLRVTRKTLANWCREAGAPSPEAFVGWSRVLRAARMLEDRGRSIEAVAIATRFGSASGLDNMFRRYLDESPGAVRRRGAVNTVLQKWVERLQLK